MLKPAIFGPLLKKHLLLPIVLLSGCVGPDQIPLQADSNKVVFDVPHLLTKNIDQVTTLLGTPVIEDAEPMAEDLSRGMVDWERSFKRDTTTLFITYNAQTRQIHHIYISTDHHRMSSYKPLLQLGNIKENEPRLIIQPQPAPGEKAFYDGVKVSLAHSNKGKAD